MTFSQAVDRAWTTSPLIKLAVSPDWIRRMVQSAEAKGVDASRLLGAGTRTSARAGNLVNPTVLGEVTRQGSHLSPRQAALLAAGENAGQYSKLRGASQEMLDASNRAYAKGNTGHSQELLARGQMHAGQREAVKAQRAVAPEGVLPVDQAGHRVVDQSGPTWVGPRARLERSELATNQMPAVSSPPSDMAHAPTLAAPRPATQQSAVHQGPTPSRNTANLDAGWVQPPAAAPGAGQMPPQGALSARSPLRRNPSAPAPGTPVQAPPGAPSIEQLRQEQMRQVTPVAAPAAPAAPPAAPARPPLQATPRPAAVPIDPAALPKRPMGQVQAAAPAPPAPARPTTQALQAPPPDFTGQTGAVAPGRAGSTGTQSMPVMSPEAQVGSRSGTLGMPAVDAEQIRRASAVAPPTRVAPPVPPPAPAGPVGIPGMDQAVEGQRGSWWQSLVGKKAPPQQPEGSILGPAAGQAAPEESRGLLGRISDWLKPAPEGLSGKTTPGGKSVAGPAPKVTPEQQRAALLKEVMDEIPDHVPEDVVQQVAPSAPSALGGAQEWLHQNLGTLGTLGLGAGAVGLPLGAAYMMSGNSAPPTQYPMGQLMPAQYPYGYQEVA